MKHYLFLFLLFAACSDGKTQKVYKWINFPTLDNISQIKESRMREFKLVEGKVKEIRMSSHFIGDDEQQIVYAKYSKSGNINTVRSETHDPESPDGISSSMLISFEYDGSKIISENLITVIEGDTVENIDKRWPEWFPILPKPMKVDEEGNPIQIGGFGDTTFSFYDEFNRKTMDSIPSAKKDDGRKITYRYDGNKIHREFYFIGSDEPDRKEVYTVDSEGNWIELKYFGPLDIDSNKVTQVYKREITYY